MERPVTDVVRDGSYIGGRIDLTLLFNSELLYLVEFKRFTSNARRRDIDRLRTIVQKNSTCIGIFAAPCYIKNETEGDWPVTFAQQLEEQEGLRCHLSDSESLPCRYQHVDGWRRQRVLIIEISQTKSMM